MKTASRRLLAGLAPLLLLAVCGAPADAHGALDRPVSRAAACAPDGGSARTAACRAAAAAGADLSDWDDIRVPGVNGRDRQVIPDGHLCSGNLSRFHGFDLARTDWPSTRLTAGGTISFRYRASIPHRGSFRFYLTRPGYDRSKPLAWSDLPAKPFLTVADPPMSGGAYQISGKLPAGQTGAHLIFTIWQTTSTPDTYYSCSDVVLAGPPSAATTAPGRSPAATGSPTRSAGAVPTAPAGGAGPTAAVAGAAGANGLEPAAASEPAGGVPGGPIGLMAAVSVGALFAAALLVFPILRRGRRGRHARP
ncbi:lytic polysaccharide monooxygenase [Plantactinospora sp. KBS50]|uniref:lytic polysaccharide monooxygenase n=1 Tax=Plantactinospora sp. KBS50 TaxID=2024580 RepID=UPI000BAAFB0C|nr:lytic polysaccharide monooxygenase [Plantactinospora sp. KBS50]ASW53152.1 hypothetical protein CIK06_01560 [Plantactinospora sp. KBS50]